MPSIMPDVSSGGVIVRSSAGVAVTPPGASTPNVYRPAADFVMTCPQTATPSNTCAPPPSAGQMNAIEGELLALAEALQPLGPWDCNVVGNLAALFSGWRDGTGAGTLNQIILDAIGGVASPDKYVTGLQSYNATTNILTLALSDGSTANIDMTTLIADALDDVVAVSADAGNLVAAGTDGGALVTPASVASVFLNCAGAAHAAGAHLPTCAEMTTAIAAAIAGLPADKFLQGLQSYNAATNILALAMSDGSTVNVDMTGLIADALDDFVIVSADAGNKVVAGTDGGAFIDFDIVSADAGNVISAGTDGGAFLEMTAADYLADLQGAGVAGQEPSPDAFLTVGTLAPVVRFDDTNGVTGFGLAAAQNSTGTNIEAYGRDAAKDNTGNGVTALGASAARNNIGTDVTAMGYFAGYSNDGASVEAFGAYSAYQNTGSQITAAGNRAALLNTGSDVDAFGYFSAAANSGSEVLAIGSNAAASNTAGSVMAVGRYAASGNTGGATNAYGAAAAQHNSGYLVNAYGWLAAARNKGGRIDAHGLGAAYYNTGNDVVAIGFNVAFYNSGEAIVATGWEAAQYNTGGSVNAFGYWAAHRNAGSNVAAHGYLAAGANTGNNVNAFGDHAAARNSSNDVDAFGHYAGEGPVLLTETVTVDALSASTVTITPATAAPIGSTVNLVFSGNSIAGTTTTMPFTVTSATVLTLVGSPALEGRLGLTGTAAGVTLTQVASWSNNSYFGRYAQGTGPNQAVLGGPTQTPCGWAPFLNISDERDKVLVADYDASNRGLAFIAELDPVAFRYDHRERYVDHNVETVDVEDDVEVEVDVPVEATQVAPPPAAPDTSGMGKAAAKKAEAAHAKALADWKSAALTAATPSFRKEKRIEKRKERRGVSRASLAEKDGSRADSVVRFGFTAQRVRKAAKKLKLDFHGVRDMAAEGGSDKLMFEDTALIPDLVLAVKQLAKQNEALVAEIAALKKKIKP